MSVTMFKDDTSNDASFYSQQSQEGSMTSTQKKKRRGFKKLGSNIRFAFGGSGKKRGRRSKKKDGDSLSEEGSYSNASSGGNNNNNNNKGGGNGNNNSNDPGFVRSDGSPNRAAQQEWIGNTGGNGLAEMAAISRNSAGGRGKSLTKITEEEHEDSTGDYLGDAAAADFAPPLRRGVRPKPPSSSAESSSSSKGSRFGWGRSKKSSQPAADADPLSLVVLLVDPSSLRFELLSLDFDLTALDAGGGRRRKKNKKKNRQHDNLEDGGGGDSDYHHLTVQDVLDQIGPSALTDDKLRDRVKTPGACKGLIDRRGQIHFGTASLERACESRPLRAVDRALRKTTDSSSPPLSPPRGFRVPTYGGEPHRDVLLGFFGDADTDGRSVSQETMADVAKSLELARPIFADPNVIDLMEKSGYDLSGWKTPSSSPKTPAGSTKLGKPVASPGSSRSRARSLPLGALKNAVLGLLAILLATVLAWSVVAGGLHLLLPDGDGSSSAVVDGPVTLEGYLAHLYALAKAWWYEQPGAAAQTAVR